MTHEHGHEHGKDPRCLEVFAQLSEYLDLELPPEACREIERHIEDCEPCIRFLDSLRGSISLVRTLPASGQPEPIPERLEQALRTAWQAALERRAGR
jgi:anti-sigma factor RsiW